MQWHACPAGALCAFAIIHHCKHCYELTDHVLQHAYYLDVQNRRPEYISTFVNELINWDKVLDHLLQKCWSGMKQCLRIRLLGEKDLFSCGPLACIMLT